MPGASVRGRRFRRSDAAPYFVAAGLEGRPVEQRQRLLGEITDALCDVLGAIRSRVRGRIAQVPAEDWGIGGVPASSRPARRSSPAPRCSDPCHRLVTSPPSQRTAVPVT